MLLNLQSHKYLKARMTYLATLASAVLIAVAIHAGPVFADDVSPSDPTGMTTRTEIADYLGRTYSETPVAGGLASNGSLLEVFTSPAGDSWTIILTTPDGRSQVVAVGETWLQLLKAKGQGI